MSAGVLGIVRINALSPSSHFASCRLVIPAAIEIIRLTGLDRASEGEFRQEESDSLDISVFLATLAELNEVQ